MPRRGRTGFAAWCRPRPRRRSGAGSPPSARSGWVAAAIRRQAARTSSSPSPGRAGSPRAANGSAARDVLIPAPRRPAPAGHGSARQTGVATRRVYEPAPPRPARAAGSDGWDGMAGTARTGPHGGDSHRAISPERGSGPGPPDPPRTAMAGATPASALLPAPRLPPGRALPAQGRQVLRATPAPRPGPPQPTAGTGGRPSPDSGIRRAGRPGLDFWLPESAHP